MKMSRMIAIIGLVFVILSMKIAYAEEINSSTINNQVVEVKAWLTTNKSDDKNADWGNREDIDSAVKGKQTEPFAVTEQIVLTIDVGTPRWFLGSTTIGNIDVPNLVAKQRKTSATNYSEIRDGHSWAHQRWEITLYPQSSGQYTIPPLPLTTHIAGDDAKKVEGTVWTNKLSFNAQLPSAKLTEKDHWFAATDAKISQNWETTRDEVKVGDAITRTVSIEAEDSLSMLLPEVLTSEPTPQYQSYADPVELSDSSTRGQYHSTRQDKVVYVVQAGGDISFPELKVKWWNTSEQKVETVVLEGQTFHVSHTPSSFFKAYWAVFAWIFSVIVVVVLIIVAIKRYLKTHDEPLILQFNRSLRKKNFAQSRLILYIKLKREMKKNAFNADQELADIGEGLVGEVSTSTWKLFWKRIIPASRQKSNLLTPLKLEKRLDDIK